MDTLHEFEALIAQFSPDQLAKLEKFIRQTRLDKARGRGQSALDLPPLDLPPLDLGRSLRSLGTREQWYDEMLEGQA